jgi:FkbM family methyltransferase
MQVARVILGRDAQVSFSQEGEDRILARLTEQQGPGFYVDVGAHHPTRFSNTALLYLAGWSGINIDPTPGTQRTFAKARPRDVNLQVGVAREPTTATLHEFSDPALNTFDARRAADLEATTDYRAVRTVQVEMLPLRAILDSHLPPGRAIDVLTVDAEGTDLEVLESNDWVRFRPRFVLAEWLGGVSLLDLPEAPLVAYLARQSYTPIARTVNTVFFVDDQWRGPT